jgi:cytochrome P450
MRGFSKGMIKESVTKGDGNDIMSILLRANASEDPNTRLTNKEVRDQIAYATCSYHH